MAFRQIRHRLVLVVLIVLVASTCGCARTIYRKVTSKETNGVRYYAPATYILVKPDYETMRASVEVLTLPDVTKMYAVDTYAWCATNKTTIDFKNGMLTKAVTRIDNAQVATNALAAIGQVLGKAVETFGLTQRPTKGRPTLARSKLPPVLLYHVSADGIKRIFPVEIGSDEGVEKGGTR